MLKGKYRILSSITTPWSTGPHPSYAHTTSATRHCLRLFSLNTAILGHICRGISSISQSFLKTPPSLETHVFPTQYLPLHSGTPLSCLHPLPPHSLTPTLSHASPLGARDPLPGYGYFPECTLMHIHRNNHKFGVWFNCRVLWHCESICVKSTVLNSDLREKMVCLGHA